MAGLQDRAGTRSPGAGRSAPVPGPALLCSCARRAPPRSCRGSCAPAELRHGASAPSCRRWARPPGRGSRPLRQLLPAGLTSSRRGRQASRAPWPRAALPPASPRGRARSPRPARSPARPGHAVLPVPRRVPRRDLGESPPRPRPAPSPPLPRPLFAGSGPGARGSSPARGPGAAAWPRPAVSGRQGQKSGWARAPRGTEKTAGVTAL